MRNGEIGGSDTTDNTVNRSRHFSTFDFIRIIAGAAVIFAHSFALTNSAAAFYVDLGVYELDAGALAVAAFFVISGYLVVGSWLKHPETKRFVTNRFARIWPAFALVVVATALVVGPMITSLPLGEYFRSQQTWGYLGHNLVMAPIEYTLPGVFESNPMPGVVNGSLWTLPYEVAAYVAVLLLGLIFRQRLAFYVVLVAVGLIVARLVCADALSIDRGVGGMSLMWLALLGTWFAFGGLLAHATDLLANRWLLVPALAALVAGAVLHEALLFIPGFAVSLTLIGTTSARFASRLRTLGDPSYGLYLYGFLVQQTLLWAGLTANPWLLTAVALPISLGLGYLSWHVIEHPSLQLARRRRARLAVAA